MKQGTKVLLVEDDENSARLLKDLLTAKGAEVTHENNGLDAIEKARKESFDLIILDLRLPGENGFVVAETLTQQAGLPAPPIIVTSAFPDKQNRRRAFQAGADAFLNKPLDLQELLLLADNFSRRKQTYDERLMAVAQHINYLGETRLHRSGHHRQVAAACREMAQEFKVPDTDLATLYKAALLHDIGLAFSEGEEHGEVGAGILEALGFSPEIVFLVKMHHKFNGSDRKTIELSPGLSHSLQILQAAEKNVEVYRDNQKV